MRNAEKIPTLVEFPVIVHTSSTLPAGEAQGGVRLYLGFNPSLLPTRQVGSLSLNFPQL